MVKKVLVGYGIDVDAVSGWINTTNGTPADVTNISRGIFGATVVTERLLKMFDHYKVRSGASSARILLFAARARFASSATISASLRRVRGLLRQC